MAAQSESGPLGWEIHFAYFFDFAAIAAFTWSLIVIYRLGRARQDNED